MITQGVHARASPSKLQLFFFTIVIIWVVVALLTWTGELTSLPGDVVVLLGIGAAGIAGSREIAIYGSTHGVPRSQVRGARAERLSDQR